MGIGAFDEASSKFNKELLKSYRRLSHTSGTTPTTAGKRKTTKKSIQEGDTEPANRQSKHGEKTPKRTRKSQ